MIWIIPIGGKGTRTKVLGEFKPFIKIRGHKVLSWFLLSIKNNVSASDKFYFLTNEYFSHKYDLHRNIQSLFEIHGLKNQFEVLTPIQKARGVSAALHEVPEIIDTNEPVTVACPDRYIDFELPPKISPKTGYLTLSLNFSKEKDYVGLQNGTIKRFAEKELVSNAASNGVFVVFSGKALKYAINKQFDENSKSLNGEYCIGPAFNYLIQKGFKIFPLLPKACYSLGSIEGINYFANSILAKGLSQVIPKEEEHKETLGAYQDQLNNFYFPRTVSNP